MHCHQVNGVHNEYTVPAVEEDNADHRGARHQSNCASGLAAIVEDFGG